MPSVDLLIQEIVRKLQATYNDDILCNQYAWWLIEALMKTKRAHLIEQRDFELTSDKKKILAGWIEKLVNQHCPLQYILGSVPFNGVDILVEPPVLIPRPETEEWTVNLINKLCNSINPKITILDLCTGSGCIAIALAKALPQAQVWAIDIEDHALRLTEKNAQHNKTSNLTIIKSDLFGSIPKDLKFDLIVGNPPYIAPEEWSELEPSVKDWEDKRALVADDHGLKIIADIIDHTPSYLKPNDELENESIPQIILEIGFRQAGRVKELFNNAGYCHIEIEQDLEKKDRIACARVVQCGYINKR